MCEIEFRRFLVGSILAVVLSTPVLAQSLGTAQPDSCEIAYNSQSSNLTARELMIQAEQRAEELRLKLFDLQSREFDLQVRLDQLDYQMTPEAIQRALVFVSSVRPLDELRDALRARLEAEKARVTKQLELLVVNREKLESAIREADAEVERLRQRLSSQ
ncbi:MAG TPA: hypothetical protein VLM38_15320 [Blastocatellia bacterium]|nr:hypothetical protein [Blastocatellia bacterium]